MDGRGKYRVAIWAVLVLLGRTTTWEVPAWDEITMTSIRVPLNRVRVGRAEAKGDGSGSRAGEHRQEGP